MLLVSGTVHITEGPYWMQGYPEADAMVGYLGTADIQVVARSLYLAKRLGRMNEGDTLHIEGELVEENDGFPIIKLTSVRRLARGRKR